MEAHELEVREAEAVINEQLPTEAERVLVLKRLLASAELANSIAPGAWSVTLFPNGFRLNVGQVEAVVFFNGELRVNLSAIAGTEPFVEPEYVTAAYRSVPQPLCAFVGNVRQYATALHALEPAHEKFVRLAAVTTSGVPRKGTSFRRSHCEGLITYARKEVGLPSFQPPNPSFNGTPDGAR